MKTLTVTSVTVAGSDVTIVGTIADVTFTQPAQRVTVPNLPTLNPNWSRNVQLVDNALMVKRNGASSVAVYVAGLITKLAIALEPSLTWTPAKNLSDPAAASAVASSSYAEFTLTAGSEYNLTYAWYESTDGGLTYGAALSNSSPYSQATTKTLRITPIAGILTSNNINVSEGNIVVIGSKSYTFTATVGTTEGNVLIGADADASLLNLIRAINHTGTPGADYYCAAVNPQVSADAAVASHKVTIRGKLAGSFTTTTTATTLSWNLASMLSLTGNYYRCKATDTAPSPGVLTSAGAQITVT